MNYRHAFHAGNAADLLKHVLVSRILVYLLRKPGAVRFIDTHAGLGHYGLDSREAERTGEWREGIGRLDPVRATPDVAALLEPFLDAVGPRTTDGRPLRYPGSPAVAQAILRPFDRLLLAELHPEDAHRLRSNIAADRRVKVIEADGYRTLNASVPPPERRGLVLIDPPFEEPGEFGRMLDAFAAAHRKWATGIYALWYPIKDDRQVASFLRSLQALNLPAVARFELLDVAAVGPGLRGSGLVVINPPYTLVDEARVLLPFLQACLDGPGRAWRWSASAKAEDVLR